MRIPILCFAISIAVAALAFSCATIQPGNDPLVVNTERTETAAKSTFDLVLNLDNNNRALWQTNAPAFHEFCEWLREPQTVEGTNTLPRASAMILSLDNIKASYVAAQVDSNTLWTALSTLTATLNQASSWMNVITNQIKLK